MKRIHDPDYVPPWIVILISLMILLTVLGVLVAVFMYVKDIKIVSLVGGLIGGLVVYILNFMSEKWALKRLLDFRKMGIRNVLGNRNDRLYYRSILSNASREVKVMGISCSRFIEDFLDVHGDDKILFSRLEKHPSLVVQLLIPGDKYMGDDARRRFALVQKKIENIRTRDWNTRIQIRRFEHEARHSFVISDDELIAGPIFLEDQNISAPAVHVRAITDFGVKYREYFNKTWEKSK